MTERLEVDLGSLLEAAETVSRLADGVPGLPVGTALTRAADALPGSRLGAAARTEAREWEQEAEALRTALAEHARGLRDAAATYRRTDQAAAAAVPAGRTLR